MPARREAGSRRDRLLDVTLGLVGDARVVERAHRRGAVEGVTQADARGGRLEEPGDVLVVDVTVDQDVLPRRARLAGVQEARHERGLDRRLEVTVLADHQRAVAAHLQEQLLASSA